MSMGGQSAFARKLEAATARKLAAKATRIAELARDESNRIISAEMVEDRATVRRKNRQRHLLGSVEVDLIWDGRTFPIGFQARSLAEKHKVGALEYGSPPHKIRAVNKEFLVFPNSRITGYATTRDSQGGVVRLEPSYQKRTSRARQQAWGNTPTVKKVEVDHPGNRPYKFLERGLRRAIKQALSER